MLVEYFGLPGSGKSTLISPTSLVLKDHGFRVSNPENHLPLPSSLNVDPSVLKYDGWRVLYRAAQFRNTYPEFMNLVSQTIRNSPKFMSEELYEFYFALTTTFYQGSFETKDQVDFTIVDEGLVQRGVSIHSKIETDDSFDEYLALLPLPDAAVFLDLPARDAMQRAFDRHPNRGPAYKKLFHNKFGGLAGFQYMETLFDRAQERMVEASVPIKRMDTALSPEVNVGLVSDWLIKLRSEQQ